MSCPILERKQRSELEDFVEKVNKKKKIKFHTFQESYNLSKTQRSFVECKREKITVEDLSIKHKWSFCFKHNREFDFISHFHSDSTLIVEGLNETLSLEID